jgi:hypothetical protein
MNLKDAKIEKVLINGAFKKFYHILIRKDEYKICVDCACNMWANEKDGSKLNRGLLNSKKDPHRTERIGRLCEMGFGKLFDMSIDTEYKKFGDTMDFLYKEKKINVKGAARYPDWEAGLVLARDNKGRKSELKQDIYVFGYMKNENKEQEQANMVLVGYQTKEFILSLPPVPARREDHHNYEIPYQDLLSIEALELI